MVNYEFPWVRQTSVQISILNKCFDVNRLELILYGQYINEGYPTRLFQKTPNMASNDETWQSSAWIFQIPILFCQPGGQKILARSERWGQITERVWKFRFKIVYIRNRLLKIWHFRNIFLPTFFQNGYVVLLWP